MDRQPSGTSRLVIGNGAVGTALASRLLSLEQNPLLIGRNPKAGSKCRFDGWGKVAYLEVKSMAAIEAASSALNMRSTRAWRGEGSGSCWVSPRTMQAFVMSRRGYPRMLQSQHAPAPRAAEPPDAR